LTQAETNGSAKPNNPQITEILTTLEPTGANNVTKQTFAYDQYNNQTNVYEFDYGTGAAPTYPKRRAQTEYLTSNVISGNTYYYDTVNPNTTNPDANATYHLRSLPKLQKIYAVNDSTGAETLVAQSEIKYDETALQPWYGTVQSWTDRGPARGNPTKVRRWLNPGNSWIELRAQFDQVGNVSKSWDAYNNQTEITYASSYHFAYATQKNSPVPDPSGQYGSTTALVISSIFDFSTGFVTSTTDANGHTTNMQYNDVLDRPTEIIRPSGGGRTNFEYGDTIGNLFVRTLTDLDTTRRLDSYQYFDGLGRGSRKTQSEGTTSIHTDTQYDSMGRVWKVSNPYRNGESVVWTTTAYDSLSRIASVTTPDSAVVKTSYSGNRVLVADQSTMDQDRRNRISVSDALGRLKEVWEVTPAVTPPDPATETVSFPGWPSVTVGYRTNYDYDVLDNLTKVTQGTQTRFFMYDSLKRLIRARNPEQDVYSGLNLNDPLTGNSQWSTGYQYDNNGNLTQKTDARGVISTYVYDALNRNTTVNYSDTTSINPDITRVYDMATNGKGRLRESYAGGTETVGANVEHTKIVSYDTLGRR
jgi:YD repeat-containing protein